MIDPSLFNSSITSIQSTLTTVIIGLITAGGTVASKKISDSFNKKAKIKDVKRQDKDIENSAQLAVTSTEQLSKGVVMTNDEKKDRACKVCAANLKRKGWDNIDEILIDSAVEKELYSINGVKINDTNSNTNITVNTTTNTQTTNNTEEVKKDDSNSK